MQTHDRAEAGDEHAQQRRGAERKRIEASAWKLGRLAAARAPETCGRACGVRKQRWDPRRGGGAA